jgi:hypothetical protein
MAGDRRRRHISVGGEGFDPGCHEPTFRVSGVGDVRAGLVVGARAGPLAFLIGGVAAGDALGAQVAARVLEEVAADPAVLRGSLLVIAGISQGRPRLPPARLARLLLPLLDSAAFGVEVRAGPPGWETVPHVYADLGRPRARRLAGELGLSVLVDAARARSFGHTLDHGGVTTLVVEAGELGRADTPATAAATAVLNLLAARQMIRRAARRPSWRAVLAGVRRLRARRGGTVVPVALPGSVLDAGATILRLCDDTGRAVGEVVAPRRCLLVSLLRAARVTPRAEVARLGEVRSLVHVSAGLAAAAPAPAADGVTRIGWCEWISLPDLAVPRLHAKIDTGARTSALHVLSMREVGHDARGRSLLEVRVPVGRVGRGVSTTVVAVEEHVVVRDSGGHAERRPVIETAVQIGRVTRNVRITLTNRGDMLFPMLVGRTTLGRDFIVDASVREVLGKDR